jgi:hypothetical protein
LDRFNASSRFDNVNIRSKADHVMFWVLGRFASFVCTFNTTDGLGTKTSETIRFTVKGINTTETSTDRD